MKIKTGERILPRQMLGAKDIMGLLGISESKAYDCIRRMNEELEGHGYLIIRGKVPVEYFKTKFYGIKVDAE